MPACDSPSSVILTKANRKIVAPPEVKNSWNKVVNENKQQQIGHKIISPEN